MTDLGLFNIKLYVHIFQRVRIELIGENLHNHEYQTLISSPKGGSTPQNNPCSCLELCRASVEDRVPDLEEAPC